MALQVFGRNSLVGRAGLEPAMLNDRIYSPARYQLRSTDPYERFYRLTANRTSVLRRQGVIHVP